MAQFDQDSPPEEMSDILDSLSEQIKRIIELMEEHDFEEITWIMNDTHELILREHLHALRSIQ
jgi:mevalonate kinase